MKVLTGFSCILQFKPCFKKKQKLFPETEYTKSLEVAILLKEGCDPREIDFGFEITGMLNLNLNKSKLVC